MNTIERLPSYLKHFVIEQNPNQYSPRDHAAWRYIMHRGLPFYRHHAVSVYEKGLSQTGLPLDRIPMIAAIDKALRKFDWGAVGVCGFIPPWAFLEFQSLRILPIATDMRSVDHIGYTPAPDIVHEAAGHAPILVDKDYRDYLERYALSCCRAIYSRQDNRLFEAIRVLSDIKEKPGTPHQAIRAAELGLVRAKEEFTYVSEQARVARMSWWTNEYGLVGTLEDPKIFGAGLLSSVAESKALYSDQVKKIRLSLACTEQAYDITEPQPQLFVARDMGHLIEVLAELEGTLANHIGGLYGTRLAQESQAVTTIEFDNHLAVSGCLSRYEASEDEQSVLFGQWQGPVQLSYLGRELSGQGIARHGSGFSCPVGRWLDLADKAAHRLSQIELADRGLLAGQRGQIRYHSGFVVDGIFERAVYDPSRKTLLYLTFNDAKVTRGNEIYYQPDWGPFDLPVVESIMSVYGGPADRVNYGEHEIPQIHTSPGGVSGSKADRKELFSQYERLAHWRSSRERDPKALADLVAAVRSHRHQEWLLLLESLELAKKVWHLEDPWVADLERYLFCSGSYSDAIQNTIDEGRVLLA